MKLYSIFLPKRYNDGKPVEISKIQTIAEQIRKKFGGYSLNPFAQLPMIQGVWTSEDKNIYSEDMFKIELFVEDTFDSQKWIRAAKEMWRQELDQKELFIIVQDADVIG